MAEPYNAHSPNMMTMMKSAFGWWLSALIVCVIGTIFSMLYVDRPTAEFLDVHFRRTPYWTWLHYTLRPLPLFVVFALFFLLGLGSCLLSGRRLPAWTLKPMLCSWSAIWALGAEVVLKTVFGRAWPDPTYLEYRVWVPFSARESSLEFISFWDCDDLWGNRIGHLDCGSEMAAFCSCFCRCAFRRSHCDEWALDFGRHCRWVSWCVHWLDDSIAAATGTIAVVGIASRMRLCGDSAKFLPYPAPDETERAVPRVLVRRLFVGGWSATLPL